MRDQNPRFGKWKLRKEAEQTLSELRREAAALYMVVLVDDHRRKKKKNKTLDLNGLGETWAPSCGRGKLLRLAG